MKNIKPINIHKTKKVAFNIENNPITIFIFIYNSYSKQITFFNPFASAAFLKASLASSNLNLLEINFSIGINPFETKDKEVLYWIRLALALPCTANCL